jgi:hypothetical protein
MAAVQTPLKSAANNVVEKAAARMMDTNTLRRVIDRTSNVII